VVSITTAPVAEDGFENPTEIVTIQVGTNDGTKLTFEQGVKLVFEGQTGNAVGWSRGGVFTPITTICSDNSQVAGNELVAGGDCKISEGGDLIVWTKHFTDFTVYTQTAVATPASSGGGGSRAVAVSTEAEPQVLGITNSSESLVNSSQQLNIQNFTPILETMSAILTAIESGRISGEISDKDVERLNNQLGQIISSLTSLLSTVL
jgi:hypothetical protein